MDTETTAAAAGTTEVATGAETTTTTQATPPPAASTTTTTETPAATETPKAAEGTTTTETPVVPEKYELKTSDGSLLKPEQVTEIEAFAKSHKLTNDQAQELLTKQEGLLKSVQDQQASQHEVTVAGWAEAAKNDKEIGGEKFTENVELAHRALKHFDVSGELAKGLDLSGFGNHPEVIRVFSKIGRAMGNDKFVQAKPSTPVTQKRPQDILYNGDKSRNKSGT